MEWSGVDWGGLESIGVEWSGAKCRHMVATIVWSLRCITMEVRVPEAMRRQILDQILHENLRQSVNRSLATSSRLHPTCPHQVQGCKRSSLTCKVLYFLLATTRGAPPLRACLKAFFKASPRTSANLL